MKKLYVSPLSAEQKDALEELYRKTNVPRVRTRAQMVLLSAEKRLIADEIAEIVRESSVTVLRWLHRYLSEGVEGLKDEPRSGHPSSVTPEFRKRLLEVARRPSRRGGRTQLHQVVPKKPSQFALNWSGRASRNHKSVIPNHLALREINQAE